MHVCLSNYVKPLCVATSKVSESCEANDEVSEAIMCAHAKYY